MRYYLYLYVIGSLFAVPFFVSAHTLNPTLFETEQDTQTDNSDKNRRNELRTYSTYPEWYIVYSAQEYASFVARGEKPSAFPYFGAITQQKNSSQYVSDMANARGESIDSETETVLSTIGISFAVEYGLIGAYEKSVGRIFELLNFGYKTSEDVYTDRVAMEYGAFLVHTPWYEFPYFGKLWGLWSEGFGLSSITPRGIERRIVFTIGYVTKGTYAGIIRFVTRSSFEEASLTTEFTVDDDVELSTDDIPELSAVDDHKISAPRYRAFLPIVERLAAENIHINTIENNSIIAVSIVSDTLDECHLGETYSLVYEEAILSQQPTTRFIYSLPVPLLTNLIQELSVCDISLEHIYDY